MKALDGLAYMREITIQVQPWSGDIAMPSKECASCSRLVPVFANGMCHGCFAEWGREKGLAPEQMPKACPVVGCDGYAVRKGLCDRHYRRFHDHGTTDKVRVVSQERRHPEYKNWLHLKTHGKLCVVWQNFWTFAEAIGERPSSRHWLERSDMTQLYGPDNWEWRAPKLDTVHTLLTTDGRRAYQQEVRAKTPQYWVGANLRAYYGLTREQYDALLAEQGGHCALCEKTGDGTEDQSQLLAVDHDHETGEIRGLLCRNHNIGIGYFADDIESLRAAISYLESGRHTGLFIPKGGDLPPERMRGVAAAGAGNVCSEPDCDIAVKAKGLCPTHYARFLRSGSTELKRLPAGTCTVQGCGQKAKAKGLCNNHYSDAYRQEIQASQKKCSVSDCEEPVQARGLCDAHYRRWVRYGSTDVIHDTRGRVKQQ